MPILLLHSAMGLRDVERGLADVLRDDGHEVVLPDLYDGASADTLEDGLALMNAIGWPRIVKPARDAVRDLPDDTVLVGVSMGAGVVAEIWRDRPTTPAVALLHGYATIPEALPAGVQASVHVAAGDPFAPEETMAAWEATAAARGMVAEVHRYPGTGHFFSDPASSDYDTEAASTLRERVRAFLRGVGV